ncbi:hypothetical protein [Candidatus Njordibacter sp. Uisw_058]|jgi:hypothetical protein|uniref:hypothetical protein n=1 Tax=Candidatus Njordibacter sp. Uisw_058 TaxID=3230974 RepID=UPI003D52E6F6
MGRRISDSDPSGKQPCAFCRTMRLVLIFAVMLVMLLAYADKLSWLRDIDFTTLFGYSMVVFFFTVLGYRVWDEYFRAKLSQTDRDARRALREQKFDELDALEAERAAAERIDSQSEKSDPQTTIIEPQAANIEPQASPIKPEGMGSSEAHPVSGKIDELDTTAPVPQATEVSELSELNEPVQPLEDPSLESNSSPEQLDLLGFSTPKKSDE